MAKTLIPYLVPVEEELVRELGISDKPFKPIIAIGGLSGSGKDTHAMLLKRKLERRIGLKLEITVAGHFVRKLARMKGFNERDLDQFMKKYEFSEEYAEKIDKRIERETLENALRNGGIYVGRMAPFTIGKWGFTVWLTVSPEVAAQRIAGSKRRPERNLPLDLIIKKIVERNNTDIKRLERIYSIDIQKLIGELNLVINNEGPKEEVSEKIYGGCVKYLRDFNFI
ncbi:MAG: AAA family ATPase [Candidatus Methanomethylicia archaeon]